MLLIGILAFGMMVGAAAQGILKLVTHRTPQGVDWQVAILAGIGGSFVGGLLISLLSGNGLALRPSGIIGSIVGAVIVTGVVFWQRNRA